MLESVPGNAANAWLGIAIFGGFGGMLAAGVVGLFPLSGGNAVWWIARIGLVFCALFVASGVRELVWKLPMVEVVHEGIRLRIVGRGRGFLFVPWANVVQVRRTWVIDKGTRMGEKGKRVPALGFVLHEDRNFQLPALRANSAGPGIDEPVCQVTFRDYHLSGGSAEAWAQRLEAHRRDFARVGAGASGVPSSSSSAQRR